MIVTESHELRAQMLAIIAEEYELAAPRGGMHVSDLTGCLTKSYWKRREPEPLSETEIGLFSIGWGLERVFISRLHMEPLVVDGIVGTPDFAFPDGTPGDLKTTRMAPGGRKGEDGFQMPEGWLRQFRAYRWMLNHTRPANTQLWEMARHQGHNFGVVVVHLIQPELKVWQLQFSDTELEDNWTWLTTRANILENLLAGDNPQPFQHNEEWECKGCVFLLKCQLRASLKGLAT